MELEDMEKIEEKMLQDIKLRPSSREQKSIAKKSCSVLIPQIINLIEKSEQQSNLDINLLFKQVIICLIKEYAKKETYLDRLTYLDKYLERQDHNSIADENPWQDDIKDCEIALIKGIKEGQDKADKESRRTEKALKAETKTAND